ncbi:DNA-formamidopyrimidine glycosylase [Deinococcus peraridilitoris]|uniref:Formamidopyrimidine-DNA glycosylase n=1 Tax=Deinococcus peraridilitoris (strain DSM 19664 / LMG 22246 / CIP 109416 / KR-200) TaxID=937777 RepID=K9ZYJ7_DEIPD|nr:DNA-formamidopyrimidine glycosylase [Deinococcus peraridilitoris]AFZ65830.1 formamidopyrimidine-DNA glycosylase Fpg [Deinococcus peraridilitoris DSM 19664]
MPELPEVETTRRQLAPLLVGRTIVRIEHDGRHRYRDTHLAEGRRVTRLDRRGKYLIAQFEDDPHESLELIVHLGMTGGFRSATGRHTRVTVHLDDGSALYFQDSRRFGKWAVVRTGEYGSMPTLQNIGPEPLSEDFDEEAFVTQALNAPVVKTWLLSQGPVAGLGNIYVDEALWRAGIHPARTRLAPEEARRLYTAIREVLTEAVEAGGSTLADHTYAQPNGESGWFQFRHNVYARKGKACARCGGTIEKIVLGQRGTHFCPECQPHAQPEPGSDAGARARKGRTT